jgi:hypothetical protein
MTNKSIYKSIYQIYINRVEGIYIYITLFKNILLKPY